MTLSHPSGVNGKIAEKLSGEYAYELFVDNPGDYFLEFLWARAKIDMKGIPQGTILPACFLRSTWTLRTRMRHFDFFCLSTFWSPDPCLTLWKYGRNEAKRAGGERLGKAFERYLKAVGKNYPDSRIMNQLTAYIEECCYVHEAREVAEREDLTDADIPELAERKRQLAEDRETLLTTLAQAATQTTGEYKSEKVSAVLNMLQQRPAEYDKMLGGTR